MSERLVYLLDDSTLLVLYFIDSKRIKARLRNRILNRMITL